MKIKDKRNANRAIECAKCGGHKWASLTPVGMKKCSELRLKQIEIRQPRGPAAWLSHIYEFTKRH